VKLTFFKYHGTGNDFILIDARNGNFKPEKSLIERMCHRRFGIGADGLITLNNARGFDFEMKYYNADGNESTMCGNGGRCIVAFADFLSPEGRPYRFIAVDGVHTASILEKDNDHYSVEISMNDVAEIRKQGSDLILDTGSPHFVRFVKDVDNIDVKQEGRFIRDGVEFRPGGINVNFVEDKGDRIYVRTYERGVEDETLSCGTGVTASALAYASLKGIKEGMINIITRGGALKLHFMTSGKTFTGIRLVGPAKKTFNGVVEL